MSFFRAFLPEDPVIVEAGAHVGTDTARLSQAWPLGHIHAFEPVPSIFTKLNERTSALRNVTCYQLALGASETTAQMFVSGGHSDGSSSLLRPEGHLREHPDVTFDRALPVAVTTLDSWAARAGVTRVDFLWLDMQGGELAALMAGPSILKNVRLIQTEVSLKRLYEGSPLYPEIRTWLESLGFQVVREELPWPDMGNVVFARTGQPLLDRA